MGCLKDLASLCLNKYGGDQMDQWKWNLKVIVERPDGTIRKISYGTWNKELEHRLVTAGCKITLPEEPTNKPPPDWGAPNVQAPPKQVVQSTITSISDADLVSILNELEENLTEKEINVITVITKYFKSTGHLSEKSRSAAVRIGRRHKI